MNPKVFLKRIADWSSPDRIKEGLNGLWPVLENESGVNSIKSGSFTAIKLTFGEKNNTGYIKHYWLEGLITALKPRTQNLFFIETNTLYREQRSNAVGHLMVAHSHGYSIENTGIPIVIADGLEGRDYTNVNIKGVHFENAKIARAFSEIDNLICISHVTGHMQAGYGGALKNMGMGGASRQGKLLQHSGSLPEITIEKCIGCGRCIDICPANATGLKKKKAILVKERCIGCGECTVICPAGAIEIKYDETSIKFQEKMVEYALGVKNAVRNKLVFINFLNKITKNCDCMSLDEEQITADIGIMASCDPVALDKASLDIIGIDKFKGMYPGIDTLAQINHAEKIKLGSSRYDLIEI